MKKSSRLYRRRNLRAETYTSLKIFLQNFFLLDFQQQLQLPSPEDQPPSKRSCTEVNQEAQKAPRRITLTPQQARAMDTQYPKRHAASPPRTSLPSVVENKDLYPQITRRSTTE
jgi:hypothetical protein